MEREREVKTEVKTNVKTEVKSEVKTNVKTEVKSEDLGLAFTKVNGDTTLIYPMGYAA